MAAAISQATTIPVLQCASAYPNSCLGSSSSRGSGSDSNSRWKRAQPKQHQHQHQQRSQSVVLGTRISQSQNPTCASFSFSQSLSNSRRWGTTLHCHSTGWIPEDRFEKNWVHNHHHRHRRWQGGHKHGHGRSHLWQPRLRVSCIVTEKIVGDQFGASADQSVRRLILLRHAKSSWTDRSIKDHERPLSKRGRQSAANIALKLHECSGWEPQLILCSDSTRTRETLGIMQEQLPKFLDGEVRYFSSFYSVAAMDGQTVQHLQKIICQYSQDDVTTILCMGHNRGWEEAASVLSGSNVELKTANAALLQTRGSTWQEAFERAGFGGWKLVRVVRPDCIVEGAVQ